MQASNVGRQPTTSNEYLQDVMANINEILVKLLPNATKIKMEIHEQGGHVSSHELNIPPRQVESTTHRGIAEENKPVNNNVVMPVPFSTTTVASLINPSSTTNTPSTSADLQWTAFKKLNEGRFGTIWIAKLGDRIAALKMFKTNIKQDVDP